MLFDLPDDDTLYAALCARDKSYEDQAFVGVTSTGILQAKLPCAHSTSQALHLLLNHSGVF